MHSRDAEFATAHPGAGKIGRTRRRLWGRLKMSELATDPRLTFDIVAQAVSQFVGLVFTNTLCCLISASLWLLYGLGFVLELFIEFAVSFELSGRDTGAESGLFGTALVLPAYVLLCLFSLVLLVG